MIGSSRSFLHRGSCRGRITEKLLSSSGLVKGRVMVELSIVYHWLTLKTAYSIPRGLLREKVRSHRVRDILR